MKSTRLLAAPYLTGWLCVVCIPTSHDDATSGQLEWLMHVMLVRQPSHLQGQLPILRHDLAAWILAIWTYSNKGHRLPTRTGNNGLKAIERSFIRSVWWWSSIMFPGACSYRSVVKIGAVLQWGTASNTLVCSMQWHVLIYAFRHQTPSHKSRRHCAKWPKKAKQSWKGVLRWLSPRAQQLSLDTPSWVTYLVLTTCTIVISSNSHMQRIIAFAPRKTWIDAQNGMWIDCQELGHHFRSNSHLAQLAWSWISQFGLPWPLAPSTRRKGPITDLSTNASTPETNSHTAIVSGWDRQHQG